jgi:hypothetical protein
MLTLRIIRFEKGKGIFMDDGIKVRSRIFLQIPNAASFAFEGLEVFFVF